MRCRNSCAIMSNAMAHSAEARIGGVDVASDADILRRAEGSDEGRLWASLATAQDAAGFCQAWLDLQCGRTRGATTATIGRAQVRTPVPNAHLVCCLPLDKKNE